VHYALPDRRELIVAVEKKRFHPPHPDPSPRSGDKEIAVDGQCADF
jgi:hypothetical protein